MPKMDQSNTNPASQHSRINLQSKQHEKLLNVIDELRSQGISRFIDLPQIIVCGDQSSGKSSVLEGVSGLKFPTKDNLCTRFATELILRRNPTISSTVTIVPDAARPDDEKKRLGLFKCDKNIDENLGNIVEEAGKAMGLEGSTKVFSSDVLRIELSGPAQPHLTLVDLPGLFHSGSKSQSPADAEAVRALVTGYMSKPRSIILAVVSAKNDFNNQIVTKYATDFDPEGARTLGIITKPDTLHSGSDSEKQYFELAENKDVYFRLGWHVLKNRDYDQRNATNDERDASEKLFFSKGIWMSLGPKQLGIDALRPRLSHVLQGQILKELPGLMKDVESGLKNCQARLDRLGSSRGTLEEQRLHLHSVSDAFTNLVKDSVKGRYDGEYFGDASTDEGYAKRTRAMVRKLLEQFTQEVRLKGHKYKIVAQGSETQSEEIPYRVSKQDRLEKVKELIERNRGTELSAISKEDTVTALFREQSSPWKDIAITYAEKIYDVVKVSIMFILDATCDQTTKDGVMGHLVNPTLVSIKRDFDEAVAKVLAPHLSGDLITYNHYLTENLQKLREGQNKKHIAEVLQGHFGLDPLGADPVLVCTKLNLKTLLDTLTLPNEANMTLFACSEALHMMEAYYKVAFKKFVDDFAVQAVEQSLMTKLETLFNPVTIFKLKEDTIEEIAGETEEARLERDSSSAKLELLQKAMDVLKRLDRGNTQNLTKDSSI